MTATADRPAATATPSRPSGPPPLEEGWNPKLLSLRLSRTHPRLSRIAARLELARSPAVHGPRDLSDLLPPGVTTPPPTPAYYLHNPVHQMTGLHWMDPRMGHRLEVMAEDFPFGKAEQIRYWVQTHVKDAGIDPKRILDVGTGSAATQFIYAELFPGAEVIGIDLAPSLLRWAKLRARQRGLDNCQFYLMDSADMSYFPNDYFDVVHEAHVLHEMPAYQIEATVREMVRLTRPGGFLGFFDWAIPEHEADWKHRELMVRINQEPFMLQYARTNFPELLKELGCQVERVNRHSNSATWKAFKGPESNRLLAETAPKKATAPA